MTPPRRGLHVVPAQPRAGLARDPFDLRWLVDALRRRSRTILSTLMLTMAAALAYVLLAPPKYTSATSVFVDPRHKKVVEAEVVQTGTVPDIQLIESQVSILGSDTILRRVVEVHGLDGDEEFTVGDFNPVGYATGLVKHLLLPESREKPDPVLLAMAGLARATRIKRTQNTYIIDVEVTTRDPVKSAILARAMVETYIGDQSTSKAEEIRKANSMIDARLSELRRRVLESENKVEDFKRSNQILWSETALVNEQHLSRLNSELVLSRSVSAEAKAKYDQVQSIVRSGAGPEAYGDAIKSALIQRLREQEANVARREAALASQLGPRHPVLVEVRSQLGEIRVQIRKELTRIVQAARSDFDVAMSREKDLEARVERAKQETAGTQASQVQLRELERESEANRGVLRAYLTRAKETQEQQAIQLPEARIISPAAVPDKPSRPARLMILVLSLLGGLGLGLARALVAENLDATLQGPFDAEAKTGLPCLAALPHLAPRSWLHRLLSQGGAGAAGPAYLYDLMAAIVEGRSPAASAFRQAVLRLLNRIRSSAREGEPSIVLLAGPRSRAGTSATSLSLAYSAALSGERVLLIDADPRHAALSNCFGRRLDAGRELALGEEGALDLLISTDTRTGLAFLPLALIALDALRTGERRALAASIGRLSRDYDLVFIDGGAPLEDEFATAFASIADHHVIVVRAGTTRRGAVDDVALALAGGRERTVGLVLTMLEGGTSPD